MKRTLAVVACVVALSPVVFAAAPVTKTASVTVKATIEAIDHDARAVTLKDKDGHLETLHVGPEVKRFDELKVGDQVTFRYSESVVLTLRKPGEPAAASSASEPVVVRGTGPKPGGSITAQETAVVLIRSIDPTTPAVTVQTEDGRTLSLKVEDKSLLKDVKTGDRVEVTYTLALTVSVG